MLERDIAKLRTQTGLFGGIKKSAQAEIAAKELLIIQRVEGLKACREKVGAEAYARRRLAPVLTG